MVQPQCMIDHNSVVTDIVHLSEWFAHGLEVICTISTPLIDHVRRASDDHDNVRW